MIEFCRVGVAMGNACDLLKVKANIICKSVVDDGLEDILKYYLVIKEKSMIVFHEESETFHLYNNEISYVFKILKIIN